MKISFRTKLGISVGLLTVLVTSSSLYYFYRTIYDTVWAQMAERLMDVGRTGSYLITPDLRQTILRLDRDTESLSLPRTPELLQIAPGETKESLSESDVERLEDGKDFQSVVRVLREIKSGTRKKVLFPEPLGQNMEAGEDRPMIRYAYLLVPIAQSTDRTILKFVADADYLTMDINGDGKIEDSEEGNNIGALYNVEDYPELRRAFQGKATADPIYTQDKWGTWISAYVPILDKENRVIAILGLDMRADSQYNTLNRMLLYYYGIIIASFILSLVISYFLSRFLTGPLEHLRLGAERVRKRDFNTSIPVKSQDEIGILADTFNSMVEEIKDYSENLERQKNAFFRFVPTQFLQILGKESAEEISPGDGILNSMSVLFSDIRSFTTISEGMTPEENFNFLNGYLNQMEPAIQRHGGFVDKYVGDAIMALFSEIDAGVGHASGSGHSADRAIRAAIEMRRELDLFNQQRATGSTIEMGIGITTGSLMLGTVGSQARIDTTVIGNTVNLAARLESITRAYRTPILISGETLRALENPSLYMIREMDRIVVKGQTKPVDVYEVFDVDPEEIREMKIRTRPLVEAGIMEYRRSAFAEAEKLFRQAYRIHPEDRLVRIYIKRCQEYAVTPPPADWDGVMKLRRK